MRIKPIEGYVGLVVLAAIAGIAMQDWSAFWSFPTDVLVGLAVLSALGLFSEATALRLSFSKGTATSSVTFLPLLACVLLFGPTASVVFFGVNGIVAEFLIRKKDRIRAVFNCAQYILSTAVAGVAFSALGGIPLALLEPAAPFSAQLGPFAGFGAVFLIVNNFLVFLAISLSSPGRSSSVFTGLVKRQTTSLFYDLFISPLGILIALLYFYLGVVGFVIGLFPLVFVRHSYLAKHRLQEANQDLLKALVMAIETRDEYTSGHSLRVQVLSETIGRALGLSGRKLDELSTAALLHDVGKIEVGYEEILQKKGALTTEERETIQSHVTRGVNILTSLSSVNPRVIDGVRGHHEAWDGSGYPAGLAGEDIPHYARIIAVCDAIDAMLSDRPYRKALTSEQVEEQLRLFKGKQFDPKVADAALEIGLIREQIDDMALARGLRAIDPGPREDGAPSIPQGQAAKP